jgi:hypothetical protein
VRLVSKTSMAQTDVAAWVGRIPVRPKVAIRGNGEGQCDEAQGRSQPIENMGLTASPLILDSLQWERVSEVQLVANHHMANAPFAYCILSHVPSIGPYWNFRNRGISLDMRKLKG